MEEYWVKEKHIEEPKYIGKKNMCWKQNNRKVFLGGEEEEKVGPLFFSSN